MWDSEADNALTFSFFLSYCTEYLFMNDVFSFFLSHAWSSSYREPMNGDEKRDPSTWDPTLLGPLDENRFGRWGLRLSAFEMAVLFPLGRPNATVPSWLATGV